MESSILCACGHPQDLHDFTDDWSGCCGKRTDGTSCWCKTFDPGPPERAIHSEPRRTRPLFSSHLSDSDIRQLAKLDPREPYGKDED